MILIDFVFSKADFFGIFFTWKFHFLFAFRKESYLFVQFFSPFFLEEQLEYFNVSLLAEVVLYKLTIEQSN
jgi:hypothetical protein